MIAAPAKTVALTSYDAFGNPVTQSGESASPFGFSTKFLDAETGFLYYGFRYYSSQSGKWLSRDPIGEFGGTNLYGFVNGDPINGIDLLGWLTVVIISADTTPNDKSTWQLFPLSVDELVDEVTSTEEMISKLKAIVEE